MTRPKLKDYWTETLCDHDDDYLDYIDELEKYCDHLEKALDKAIKELVNITLKMTDDCPNYNWAVEQYKEQLLNDE